MRFSETIKLTDPELVISRRHDAWVAAHDHPRYSLQALDFAHRVLTSRGRKREGTVSASSLGGCQREQQFTYLGLPKLAPSTQNRTRMQNGLFMHLRWQMEGLTEGWLMLAEVPVQSYQYRLRGTMDGIAYDESVVELKSINANGFARVMTFGPLMEHLYQMASYMLCTGRQKGIFIYENKDTQEYREIIVTPDQVPLDAARERARSIWEEIDGHHLHEPLEKCIDKEGYLYHSCPYRDRCLSIHEWKEVA